MPEIVYGFGPTINWKNWTIAAWFKGISNVDIMPNGDGFRPFMYGGERGNLLAKITDRWTPDNPDPRPFYPRIRSEEHTSELQSLMRISYAVFCFKTKKKT